MQIFQSQRRNLVFPKSQVRDIANTLSILVTSDNHLGFKETHAVRGNDSFDAFQEVMESTRDRAADLVLLGGDLFDSSVPSLKTIHQACEIFRNTVIGNDAIDFELQGMEPNFVQENINIGMPVFVIHGNHDQPVSEYENRSAQDLLQINSYVNRFGHQQIADSIVVSPIILHKGTTTVCLYGLSYVKDARLAQLFAKRLVEFRQPPTQRQPSFNILVVHQNRFKGSAMGKKENQLFYLFKKGTGLNQCLDLKLIPDWMHLVIWGHEHECKAEVEVFEEHKFHVYQPGSTIATSLIEAEEKPKGYGVFRINGLHYDFEQHFLVKSLRPMAFEQVELGRLVEQHFQAKGSSFIYDEEALKILANRVQEILEECENKRDQDGKKLPIVRLKVEYQNNFEVVRIQELENRFKDSVANPGEIFRFWKRPKNTRKINVRDNPNLNENFIQTIENKESFNTLGKEAYKDVITIFAQKVNEMQPQLVDGELVMDQLTDGLKGGNTRSQIFEGHFEKLMKDVKVYVNRDDCARRKRLQDDSQDRLNLDLQVIEENLEAQALPQRFYDEERIQQLRTLRFKDSITIQLNDYRQNLGDKIRQAAKKLHSEAPAAQAQAANSVLFNTYPASYAGSNGQAAAEAQPQRDLDDGAINQALDLLEDTQEDLFSDAFGEKLKVSAARGTKNANKKGATTKAAAARKAQISDESSDDMMNIEPQVLPRETAAQRAQDTENNARRRAEVGTNDNKKRTDIPFIAANVPARAQPAPVRQTTMDAIFKQFNNDKKK